MPLRFSVVMATYNGARFLQEQLDSIARQTQLPSELVVCDDDSEDTTFEILDAFQLVAPFPVRLLRNASNRGHAETFMRAVVSASGDWLVFSDQDDVWLDHKLASYAAAILAHPDLGLLSHSAVQVDEKLARLPHRVPNHRRFRIAEPLENRPLAVLPGFTCCIRKSLLDTIPIDERPDDMHRPGRKQSHDHFIYHLANSYSRTAYLPETLALYRRHATAVSGHTANGVYDYGLRARLRDARYSAANGYLFMADQARQHRDYYALIKQCSERCAKDGVFLARTEKAIAYYAAIAATYSARAQIHDQRGAFLQRARAFLALVSRGAYGHLAGLGRGLGHRALVKDAARVCFSWQT